MTILEALSEEECYLWAILSDPSGLDIAEFAITNEEDTETGCFRAWPFQWPWWRCSDVKQIEQGSRSSGKSMSIRFRALAFPFIHPDGEMVVTAPEGVHLDAITDVIENMYVNNRLPSEMLVPGRTGIKHRPFKLQAQNGAHIIGRLPQRDGKGLKGIHPLWLELDEGQDFTEKAWNEIIETLKQGQENRQWRVHGVSRGVHDRFYEYTQPDSDWRVHHYPAMYRPTWTDEEREDKIKDYLSVDSPDFRRNVYGVHGDETSPIFDLYRLMDRVDQDQDSKYNLMEYQLVQVDEGDTRVAGAVPILTQLPDYDDYVSLWMGMDVGYAKDPSVICLFGQPNRSKVKLKLLARLVFHRLPIEHQSEAILYLVGRYRPLSFAMDKTGNGLPLFQQIQHMVRENNDLAHLLNRIKGYGFSEKLVVGFDESVGVRERMEEKNQIRKNVLEVSTDILRSMVDDGSIMLPWDKELIGEFQCQTMTYAKNTGFDSYGRRRKYTYGSFHTLDACRLAALGFKQYDVEAFLEKHKEPEFEPVETLFFFG